MRPFSSSPHPPGLAPSCQCSPCKLERRLSRRTRPKPPEHGLRGYHKGCRCPECKQAKSAYRTAYRVRAEIAKWVSLPPEPKPSKPKVIVPRPLAVPGSLNRSYSRLCLQHNKLFDKLCPEGEHAPERFFGVVCREEPQKVRVVELSPEDALEWKALADGKLRGMPLKEAL